MRTSGVVLDIYDDFQGHTLRALYPSFSDIPEQVKTARVLKSEDLAGLPDDVFALVLQNDGHAIRKYACIDEGNTTLSVEFFVKHAHKLPVEARKLGAENLKVACAWYNIPVPEELEKIALGASPILAGVASIPVLTGTAHEIGGRQSAISAMGGSDGTIITPHQRDAFRAQMAKSADITGGSDNPLSAPLSKLPLAGQSVVKKTAMGHLLSGRHATVKEPGEVAPAPGKMPERLPQQRVMRPHVDVTNKEPPTLVKEKKAGFYALPGKYPLDNYAQVKEASAYFDQYSRMFTPEERREYCVNMVKRASELGIGTSDVARKYAANSYAPAEEIKVGYALRREALSNNDTGRELLEEIYEKRASIQPELFASMLSEFDKIAHLDFAYSTGLPDAFYSTFGEKVATEDKLEKIDEDWSYVLGNDFITKKDLCRWTLVGLKAMKNTFNDDIAKKFQEDPVKTFEAMPTYQKKIVMRMATDNSAGISPVA